MAEGGAEIATRQVKTEQDDIAGLGICKDVPVENVAKGVQVAAGACVEEGSTVQPTFGPAFAHRSTRCWLPEYSEINLCVGTENRDVRRGATVVDVVLRHGLDEDAARHVKRFWGAFDNTPLEAELHKRGVETIVLCGISTDIGVETTARSAATLGFNVVVAEDATSARSVEAHDNAIERVFPSLGRVRSAAEIEAALA